MIQPCAVHGQERLRQGVEHLGRIGRLSGVVLQGGAHAAALSGSERRAYACQESSNAFTIVGRHELRSAADPARRPSRHKQPDACGRGEARTGAHSRDQPVEMLERGVPTLPRRRLDGGARRRRARGRSRRRARARPPRRGRPSRPAAPDRASIARASSAEAQSPLTTTGIETDFADRPNRPPVGPAFIKLRARSAVDRHHPRARRLGATREFRGGALGPRPSRAAS